MRLLFRYLLTSTAFGVAVAYSNTSTSICDSLASALPDKIFFPETDTYNSSIFSYPFIQLRLHPSCIIRPKSSLDISTAVKILGESENTKFAIRGGGHNVNAGFNNVDNGVTFDMQSLKDVQVDEVVRVGAGALWQHVYDAVEPRNISVLGGRIGVVGVAGFTTGGGISFFSPERGWSCDSVVNFELVLANGEIVNANATSRADLFIALKGGQNNFGIVTRFDFKPFPQGQIWGGRTAYGPEADLDLLSEFVKFKDSKNYDPYAAGWITFRYNGTGKIFTPTSTLWYTKPELKPGALGGMTAVHPQVLDGKKTAYASEFTRNASLVVTAVTRRTIWATMSFRVNPAVTNLMYAYWKDHTPKVCETYAYAKVTAELSLQSIPPPMNGSHANSLGFAPDSTPHKDLAMLQVVFLFEGAEATEGLQTELKDYIKIFEAMAEKNGVAHNFVYLNYAAAFQDPLGAYGAEQLKGLRDVARKYDPRGMFQKQVIGGFKIV